MSPANNMHPYRHVLFHRGPSRVFWFLLGAGAVTWWHHASLLRDNRAEYFPCVIPHRRIQGTPPQGAAPWTPDEHAARSSPQRDWEQDREHLRHLQKRAGETVVDLSESTLDSIISGAESLRAKLVQLRAERQQLESEKHAT